MKNATWDLILKETQALHDDVVAWREKRREDEEAHKIELPTIGWPPVPERRVLDIEGRLERLEEKVDAFDARLRLVEERLKLVEA